MDPQSHQVNYTWSLSEEYRCRRETIWLILEARQLWSDLWGPCDVDLRPGGRFLDHSEDILPSSFGEFVQVIPYRRFDLYWYLNRSRTMTLPDALGPENSIRLSLTIEETAPSVQMVTVRAEWKEETYPPRGKWVGLAKAKWRTFLENLAVETKKMTRA
jgi:hypothetical protein